MAFAVTECIHNSNLWARRLWPFAVTECVDGVGYVRILKAGSGYIVCSLLITQREGENDYKWQQSVSMMQRFRQNNNSRK
eukprot:1158581-Pelagomonas_calceolata.AAC.8